MHDAGHRTYLKMSFLVITTLLSRYAMGQEFWLRPDKVFYKTGDTLNVTFLTGENFDGKHWELAKNNIEKLEIYTGGVASDVTSQVREGKKDNVSVPLQKEGTALISLQTVNTFREVEAEKFNASLNEDGLDDVISQRMKSGKTNSPTKENYSCFTKLFVQVGDVKDDAFKKVTGFPIEIVPDKNPSSLKKGDVLHFKILYQGKPLFGAKVRIWNYFDHLTTTQNIFTQQDGTIEMTISGVGSWLINVVKMVPSKDENADWQSYRGTLIFGIK